MASMLPLPSPQSLSGEWQLSSAEGECQLEFMLSPNSRFRDFQLDRKAGQCSAIDEATGWRPTPDGITLTDSNGGRVAFFARDGKAHYVARQQQLALTRVPS
ncbi:AprI/Inh family metalloprotease inhibitor [Carnimonas bestiolae]|uniref:AprI/Inh family metalloprotease inhibitor n=1 Tax=Carnimonas bestiolae TaxID=3402172 RepID=UPI003EDBEA13